MTISLIGLFIGWLFGICLDYVGWMYCVPKKGRRSGLYLCMLIGVTYNSWWTI